MGQTWGTQRALSTAQPWQSLMKCFNTQCTRWGLFGVRRVTAIRSQTCDKCHTVIFSKPYIQIKIRLQHCSYCDKIFKTKSHLVDFFVEHFFECGFFLKLEQLVQQYKKLFYLMWLFYCYSHVWLLIFPPDHPLNTILQNIHNLLAEYSHGSLR